MRKSQVSFKNKMTESAPGLITDSDNLYMSKSTRYGRNGMPLAEAYHYRQSDTWAQVEHASAFADVSI
jgi:hypothetical protein